MKTFLNKIICLLFLAITFSLTSCELVDDLLGLNEEEDEIAALEKPGYNFSFTCPRGSTSTVPIPAASPKCQKAYEYFAKMYGCNEADFFNAANCLMCTDCELQNYCSICE